MPNWMRRLDASLLTELEAIDAERLAWYERLVDCLIARHTVGSRTLLLLRGGLS